MLQPVLPAVTALMTSPVGGMQTIKFSARLAMYPLETLVSVRSDVALLSLVYI